MSAPQGTPASGAAPRSAVTAARTRADPRMPGIGLARGEGAAGPRERDRRLLVVGGAARPPRTPPARPAGSSPTAHADAALEDEPVGHGARPLARCDAADVTRVGQRQRAHRGVDDGALMRRLVLGQRAVDGDVAVDRASGPRGASRRARRRPRTVPSKVRRRPGRRRREAGRLRDQRGVEAVVALQRGERPEAAVLLGRARRGSTTSGVGVPASRSAASACSAAITPPFMSTLPRPCTRRPSIAPDHGP